MDRVEIFIKGSDALTARYGDTLGQWVNVASFFGGILLIGLIDNLIPEAENPHETHAEEKMTPIQAPAAPTSNYNVVAPNQVEEASSPGFDNLFWSLVIETGVSLLLERDGLRAR